MKSSSQSMSGNDNREETLFNAALQLATPEERAAYLKGACAGDEPLRQHILALLQGHDQVDALLDKPRPALPVKTLLVSTAMIRPTEKAGDIIGHYKLLQQIGEGGCGVVYMADQEDPVRRRVALKIVKLGMDTKEVIVRFEAERQALALMDHPNIAKVFDAGSTETGRPYFVMELVHGIRITEYCDQNHLPTRERLGLFSQVCHAVQHAHQKGIIHRDIKPSNILVTMHDGVPVPKVIDFGIAKATEQRLTDKTLFTAYEQFMGTPAYMSPEQAEMSGLGIDTRSDIYSLGVLLYELLTGKTPFDAKELLRAGLDEMRRTIREKEPARPSTRLSTMQAADLTTLAKFQQSDAPKLIHLLRGDLDWVVMKALEKDRTRRYETAAGLAADIQRHLQNEPVVARPPSNLYRLQKMLRRNKLAVAATAAVLGALIIGLGLSVFFLINEKQQRAIAEVALRESKTSEAKALTAETAAETMTKQLLEVVKLYGAANTEEVTNDESFQRSVLQLQRRVLGDDSLEVVNTMRNLCRALEDENKQDEAESVLREALAVRAKISGTEAPNTADLLALQGEILLRDGKTSEGEASFQQALALLPQNGTNNLSQANAIGMLSALAKLTAQPRDTNNSSDIDNFITGIAALQNGTNSSEASTNTNKDGQHTLAEYEFQRRYYQKVADATKFLLNLKEQGQLPGWLKDEHGNLTCMFVKAVGRSNLEPLFDPEIYPISMPFYCTKATNDVSTYHFDVVQISKDSPWKLQKAWRTSPDGKTIGEYSIK